MSKRTKTYRPRRKVRHSVANPFMAPPKAEVRREIEALTSGDWVGKSELLHRAPGYIRKCTLREETSNKISIGELRWSPGSRDTGAAAAEYARGAFAH